MHSTTVAGSSTSASAPVNPSYDSNIAHLLFSDLVAMSAKTLCLHLNAPSFQLLETKLRTMANHRYQLLHHVFAPPNNTSSAPGTASPTTAIEPSSTSTINIPCQVIKQLSTFFQLFSHQVRTSAE